MFVGSVVDDEIHDEFHAVGVNLIFERIPVLDRTVSRVGFFVIRNVVALVVSDQNVSRSSRGIMAEISPLPAAA